MTIADLAGPVLLRVLPTTFGVLLLTSAAASLPLLVPRFLAWLRGPAEPAKSARSHTRGPRPMTDHQPQTARHADQADEAEQVYSI